MPYADSDTSGGKVRLKHSGVASETIGASGLVAGELALNTADGVMYFRDASASVGQFPSATGIKKIVKLTQPAFNALATKDQSTLYVIVPSATSPGRAEALPNGYENTVLGYVSGTWQAVAPSPLQYYEGQMSIAPGASESTTIGVITNSSRRYSIDGWVSLSISGANNGYSPNPTIAITGPAGNTGHVWWPMYKKGESNDYALWCAGTGPNDSWKQVIGTARSVFASSSTGFNSGATLFIPFNGWMQTAEESGSLGLAIAHVDPTPTGNSNLSVTWHLRTTEHS